MVQLQEIACSRFLLFHADQPADQVQAALTRARTTHVIIRRRKDDTLYYYLYKLEDLRTQLQQAPGGQSLEDALILRESKATPPRPPYANAKAAPPQCVVTENGQIFGFYDNRQLPAPTIKRGSGIGTGTEALEAESGLESLSGPPVARTVQADFPEQVAQGETASLLVSLVREAGTKPGLPVATPLGTELDVVVQPQRGFEVVGRGEGKLMVTDEAETLPLQIKLRATGLGQGRVRVLCFQSGQPLGAVTLNPTIVPAGQAAGGQRAGATEALAPLRPAQPDLSLLVLEHEYQGKPALTVRLTAADPALGLSLKPFGPIPLKREPLQYFQDFFKDIERLPLKTPDQQKAVVRKMALKGLALFQDFLPADLQVLLWSVRDRIGSVQVQSDEPWIPWELFKLQGKENGKIVEGPFFCEAFAMTRWFPGLSRRLQLSLKNLALVIPPDSGLSKAPEESKYLRDLATGTRTVTEIPATYLEVTEKLSSGAYDGWHFTGHGRFEPADPNRSPIQLLRGELSLCAEDICGSVGNCGLTEPLVFLNACQTGHAALSLTGMGGWAHRFVQAGAGAFLGTLWSVDDGAAFQFAQNFYDRLLARQTIGQAAREARLAIQGLPDPTWLAYTVFADPLATVRV